MPWKVTKHFWDGKKIWRKGTILADCEEQYAPFVEEVEGKAEPEPEPEPEPEVKVKKRSFKHE